MFLYINYATEEDSWRGRPIGAKATKVGAEAEELHHPGLHVNEIHKLMKECASFSKKEARSYSSSYFKQLVDMFNVLAFNALEGTAAYFKSVVKCEQILKLLNEGWPFVCKNRWA